MPNSMITVKPDEDTAIEKPVISVPLLFNQSILTLIQCIFAIPL